MAKHNLQYTACFYEEDVLLENVEGQLRGFSLDLCKYPMPNSFSKYEQDDGDDDNDDDAG